MSFLKAHLLGTLGALLLAAPAQSETLTFTGADSSGGGKVVACRHADGSLRSAELLDLFEARALYGLTPSPGRHTVDDYLNDTDAKMEAIFKGAYFMINPFFLVKEAKERMRLLPAGTELVNLDDAEEIALPVGCKTEQLAVYRENALLLINSDLWSALDERNRAALFVHEGIYQLDRVTGAKNSIYARKVTGHLFSSFQFEPLMAGVPRSVRQCVINSKQNPLKLGAYFNFFLYETPGNPGTLTLHFIGVDGRTPFAKTYAVVPALHQDRGGSIYLRVQSGFETLSGISLGWKSWEELKEGKFGVFLPGEGVLEAQCSEPIPGTP